MRRQCLRIFSTINSFNQVIPKYYCSTMNTNIDYKSILQELNTHTNEKSFQDITTLIFQLKPFFNQFGLNELQNVVQLSHSNFIEDEGYAQKVLQRSTELFLQQQATLTDTLTLISQTLSGRYSENLYKQQINFIKAVSEAPQLDAIQIGYAMLIYGQVVYSTQFKDNEIETQLLIHFKQQIDSFTSEDLRNFTFGTTLAQISNNDIYELIERQSINIDAHLVDLIRIANGIVIYGSGSKQFWKLLEEKAIKGIVELDQENLCLLMMLYKQTPFGTKNMFQLMSINFLKNYGKFTNDHKLQMFSGFIRVCLQNKRIWNLFFRDISQLILKSNINQMQMILYDCQNALILMPVDIRNIFINYILKHSQEMNIELKKQLHYTYQIKKILTKELSVALLK